MAAKVALTAEEFRENSQRSIALFNTEKLSTDSTHVLKSAYCNSVHFCRCNLHGACGGKVTAVCSDTRSHLLQSARGVWRQSGEARRAGHGRALQSARGVWRQRDFRPSMRSRAFWLQSARGVWRQRIRILQFGDSRTLQSARGVWRQRADTRFGCAAKMRCNLHGACGGKAC